MTRSWMARSSFACRRDVHLGDFVEQQRAAMGLLELADAPRHGAGEGALLVTEQLGFEEILGDRGAVDRDEGLVLAQLTSVHVAGHHLLAGAALAGDEHRGVRAGDLLGELDDALHRGVAPHEGALIVGHRLEHGGDELRIGRQRDVFVGAGLDGGHGGARVGAGAAGDDRRADALGFERSTKSRDGERDVDHHQVGALGRAAPRAPARRCRRG